MKTIKTFAIILTSVLALHFNTLFAGNEGPVLNKTEIEAFSLCPSFTPNMPAEATFEEDFDGIPALVDFFSLVPTTPKEADFKDAGPDATFNYQDLVPVTPVEADFNDDDTQIIPAGLVHITPSVADFTDPK